MKLTRRRFAALAAGSVTVTAGCLDGDENDGRNGNDYGNGDGGDDRDDGVNDENGDEETTEFRGHELPSFPHADRTVWYHDRGDAPVYVEPSDETVEPPAEVEFTLRNEGNEEFGINPYSWNVYKLHDGDWKLLRAREIPEPWQMVEPGGTVSQTVGFGDDADYAVGDGVYGFYLGRRDRGAAFEVTGAELILEPVDETVTSVERDDGVVTVYTTYYDEIEEYQTPGTLVVRRGDETEPTPYDIPTLIREQAANEEVLRNTLPQFEEGVDEVHLKIPTTRRGSLGQLLGRGVSVGGGEVYFIYEGDEYAVELFEE